MHDTTLQNYKRINRLTLEAMNLWSRLCKRADYGVENLCAQ